MCDAILTLLYGEDKNTVLRDCINLTYKSEEEKWSKVKVILFSIFLLVVNVVMQLWLFPWIEMFQFFSNWNIMVTFALVVASYMLMRKESDSD